MAEGPLGWTLSLADWVVTYGLHSTLALGAVWAAERIGLLRQPATRDLLWKSALLLGLLTASWKTAAGPGDLAGAPGASPMDGRMPAPVRSEEVQEVRRHAALLGPPREGPRPAGAGRRTVEARLHAPSDDCLAAVRDPRNFDAASIDRLRRRCDAEVWRAALPGALLGLWAGGALVLLLIAAGRRRGLRALLANRQRIRGGRERRLLDQIAADAGLTRPVELYWVEGLESPAVIGPGAIGLPARARELAGEELAAALGHEVAHLARRDRLWLGLARFLSVVGFVQPLNRLALRRLEETAELLADDWAVRRLGNPLGLARTLTTVAGWRSGTRPSPVLSMASTRSPLEQRVRRLLAGRGPARPPLGRRLAGVGVLCLCIASLPALSLPPASVIRTQSEPPRGEGPDVAAVQADERLRIVIQKTDR